MKPTNMLVRFKIVLSIFLIGCAGTRGAVAADVDGSDTECLLLDGAEIVPPDRPYEPTDEMTMQEQLALANQGHVITRGSSTIIAVREFTGRNGAVDGQRYRKLTVKLDGQGRAGSNGVVQSHYVIGSSAFVAWGLYYVSTEDLKAVTITDKGPRRFLTIEQKLSMLGIPDGEEEEIDVSFECELKRKRLDQLSAWEGSATVKNDPFYP